MMRMLKPLAVFGLLALLSSPALALSKNDELLVYQANFGTAAEVRKLLDTGANPDAVGEDGWPTISLAAMRGDDEGMRIVRMLVDAGANLNVRDANGETPLMNAITTNNAPLVKYMIEHGADFHATSKSGRTVLSFAEHYGTDEVEFLVKEAIRLEEERIREGRSRKYLYRMLDDFVYYNCALQYLSYSRQTGIFPKDKLDETGRKIERVTAKIGNAQVELEYTFRMNSAMLQSIAKKTQTMIFDELEGLISTRNRLKQGVGKDADLDKRCQKILGAWRESFIEYDRRQQQFQNQDGGE